MDGPIGGHHLNFETADATRHQQSVEPSNHFCASSRHNITVSRGPLLIYIITSNCHLIISSCCCALLLPGTGSIVHVHHPSFADVLYLLSIINDEE